MQTVALLLSPDVRLTLANEGDGWRFAVWSHRDGRALTPPSPTAQARRFTMAESAGMFFSALYASEQALARRVRQPAL